MNTMPNIKQIAIYQKCVHPHWLNLFWDARCITNARIIQVLKLCYKQYLGNYKKKYILKQDISPLCNLCPFKQNHNCLHLSSCCTHKHIYNLCTNQHNSAARALANTLLAHPTTRCFKMVNATYI